MESLGPLLKMEGIGKSYFGNRVLKNVSFTLNKGQILGLVGENGAGKSTLMNILFGMNVIHDTGGYEGRILINNREIRFDSPLDALEAGVGMVHQEFSLIPGFTATENIVLNRESTKYNILVESFGERLKTLDKGKMKERARSAINKLNVELVEDTLVTEMPVGHKQFTEIAREIDKENTQILVLDEPTAVLTESEADILLKSMKRLSELGIAIIFISHRLQEIMEICDKIIVLRDGEVVEETIPSETSIKDIASHMVGRSIESAFLRDPASLDRSFTESILTVRDLWVDMPGETVRKVSLDIYKGEIFGIGGLAGQGKLGIANGIMGMFPAGGNVTFQNEPITLNEPRSPLSKGLAAVFEDRRGVGLLLEEPISWNIIFTALQMQEKFLKPYLGGVFRIRDTRAINECTRYYINALEIKCINENQEVQELSGGNQQKVCLAKAFATRPRLLFVAEPTRGIDVGAKRVVLDTLKDYNRKYDTTIVMISSELEELRSICDRIAIVNEGKIAGILPATAESTEFGILMLGKVDNGAEGEKAS